MANVKISNLPAATSPVASTDVLPVVQGGVTKKAAINQLGFLQAGTGAVTRTAQAKMRDTVSVKDFGAVGDGVADDTAAIQAALNSGATHVVIEETTNSYRITAITIPSTVKEIVTIGQPRLTCVAATNSVAITDNAGQFFKCGDMRLVSTGTKGDGLNTVGIYLASKSYQRFGRLRFENFSLAGLRQIQTVFIEVQEVTGNDCNRIISLERDGASVPCVEARFGRCYLSGSTRGLFSNGTVNLSVDELVLEYSGSSSSTDGALHLVTSSALIGSFYCEANQRNLVFTDSPVVFTQRYVLAATAADVISYSGLAFDRRGITQLDGNTVRATKLLADDISNLDLIVGENLTVPVAGGSVKWGTYTVERATGTATSATWTTIKTLTGQSGGGETRLSYRYEVYAGRSDLTTGYDKGSIINGTLYSDTGSNPAWLRVSGNDLQVNITSSSYGLNWGLTTTTAGAIG